MVNIGIYLVILTISRWNFWCPFWGPRPIEHFEGGEGTGGWGDPPNTPELTVRTIYNVETDKYEDLRYEYDYCQLLMNNVKFQNFRVVKKPAIFGSIRQYQNNLLPSTEQISFLFFSYSRNKEEKDIIQ